MSVGIFEVPALIIIYSLAGRGKKELVKDLRNLTGIYTYRTRRKRKSTPKKAAMTPHRFQGTCVCNRVRIQYGLDKVKQFIIKQSSCLIIISKWPCFIAFAL